MHFVGSPATNMARLKRAGRRSIAAQKTFEIVHFLARPGAIAGGNTHRIETRTGVESPFASRRAPERIGAIVGAKLAWRALHLFFLVFRARTLASGLSVHGF